MTFAYAMPELIWMMKMFALPAQKALSWRVQSQTSPSAKCVQAELQVRWGQQAWLLAPVRREVGPLTAAVSALGVNLSSRTGRTRCPLSVVSVPRQMDRQEELFRSAKVARASLVMLVSSRANLNRAHAQGL